MEVWTWVGIAVCLAHSAIFSGLNLALLGGSRLRLEIAAESGDERAQAVLQLREDYNRLLCTILWGNVAVNTGLAILMESVMVGTTAFVVSTFGITIFGEIVPQAWFSRHALAVGAALAPLIRIYRVLLAPLAWPSARVLDAILGPEAISWFREVDVQEMLRRHMEAEDSEIDRAEAQGAMNFLEFDDLPANSEGEPIHPDSILALETRLDLPVIPEFERDPKDAFLAAVQRSGKKWVILTGMDGVPHLALDADAFLRSALMTDARRDPYRFCHRPIVVHDAETDLGDVIRRFRVEPAKLGDDVIDRDVVLVWTPDDKRIITGADVLGRLLRGIAVVDGE